MSGRAPSELSHPGNRPFYFSCRNLALLRKAMRHDHNVFAVVRATRFPVFVNLRTLSTIETSVGPRQKGKLHNHDVPPASIQLRVISIYTDLTKTQAAHEPAAWLIFGEDAGNKLPEAGLLCLLDEPEKGFGAAAGTSLIPPYVDGAFRDPRIAFPRAVHRSRGERNDLAIVLHHDNDRVNAVEPGRNVSGRPKSRFESRNAILNALVVNLGDGPRVRGTRRPGKSH